MAGGRLPCKHVFMLNSETHVYDRVPNPQYEVAVAEQYEMSQHEEELEPAKPKVKPEVAARVPTAAAAATSKPSVAEEYRALRDQLHTHLRTKVHDRDLPERAVMTWWILHRERIKGMEQMLMRDEVVPFLNVFWCHVRFADCVVVKAKEGSKRFKWVPVLCTQFKSSAYISFTLAGISASGSVALYWLRSDDKFIKDNAVMSPPGSRKEDAVAEHDFNTFSELAIPHAEALSQGNSSSADAVAFKAYFFNGFLKLEPDPQAKEYTWKWYCSQYQRPGYRLKRALLLYSTERQVGKTYMVDEVGANLLGTQLSAVQTQDEMFGKYNEVLENKLLMSCDEFSHDDKIADVIKNFITNGVLTLHKKHQSRQRQTACLNVQFTANRATAFNAKEWEERGLMLQIGLGIKDPEWKHLKDKAWNWHDIGKMFLEQDLKTWDPEKLPAHTVGLAAQVQAAEGESQPMQQWWRHVLSRGGDSLPGGVFDPTKKVPTALLYRQYVAFHGSSDRGVKGERFALEFQRTCVPSYDSKKSRKSAFQAEAWATLMQALKAEHDRRRDMRNGGAFDEWAEPDSQQGGRLPTLDECRERFRVLTSVAVEPVADEVEEEA